MNTPIEISNLTEYINQIDEITHPEKSYLYRGQEDETWRVTSSAYRRLISSSEGLGREADLQPYSLRRLYQNYLLKIIDEIKLKYPSTYRNLSPLECMAHLQHNRVATGLIDFTFSPLVALWFACTNENINGKVIMLENDSGKIKELTTIEQLQQDLDTFFSVDESMVSHAGRPNSRYPTADYAAIGIFIWLTGNRYRNDHTRNYNRWW